MTQITPLQLSLNKGTATQVTVAPINVQLFKDNCESYWQLFDENNQQLESGNLNIPSEIYLNWADDDNIILDYVITSLGLEKL